MTRRRGSPVAVAALVAACALLALLAYGVLAQRPARGIDAALAAGKRPAAPELVLPRLDGGRRVSLRSLARIGRGAQLLGLVVHAVP